MKPTKKQKPTKPPFMRCDVTGREYHSCMVRECFHPQVLRRYGKNGKANVSIYVCRKCRHKVTVPDCGMLGCSYNRSSDIGE